MNADGTMICPLCRRLARMTQAGRLYLHFGREQSIRGHRARSCKASRHTPEEAQTMAKHADAELESLRQRAHP